MKWSKLKKLIENRVAASISKRFSINSTAYGNCSCGHAWITIDKDIVANFCTRAFWNRCPRHFDPITERWKHEGPVPFDLPASQKNFYAKQEVEYGELSRQDAYKACWDFIHNLSIDEALKSDNPLIQTLAIIDSRIGKRRLLNIKVDDLHPLARKLILLRATAEGVNLEKPSSM